jgi:tryptophanyl-tRNA synthetase
LSIFKNVNFAQKQEAFELQINVNHRQYLEAFLENFPNFNVKFNNFSNFKKKNGAKKMSKSDPSDASRINLLDTPDDIAKKIKRATSDSELLPFDVKGLEGRAEAANLVGIYAVLNGQGEQDVLDEFGGHGFGKFKPALADLAVAKLGPVADTMRRLMEDPAEVDRVLKDGGERANAIAAPVMDEVRRVIGFWRP